ncbi:hypothetical protein NQ315_004988 [Exocentrus adspersus]|uniref:histone deacetylase n=1 Tax=Exocentrus adspersus TaxID=1586481 RepID=A0AAV8V7W7_9CUCU|nr:hypothetical protein NQ315_004988 [Exocentrus adspersus]
MTHALITNYGLFRHMDVFKPEHASYKNLVNYHSRDYINFLQSVCKDNVKEMDLDLLKFNVGEDCPIFHGLFDYCKITTGGSLAATLKLNNGDADISINWAGGLHHAKKSEASGFCYVNDIVLAILELLKYNERVLYIDIDVHHGDGVEEAFYTTDRVMTVSFHKYGDYFPGTGSLCDTGLLKGKNYAVNVPLKDGITDRNYQSIFNPVINKVIEMYKPSVIVMQCGADSLSGDRLGCFNLSHLGHAACLKHVKSFNIPMLVLGGGGYTIKNVSKAWAYETKFHSHYGPDYKINVPTNQMKDYNTKKDIDTIIETIHENLRHVTSVPSVQLIETPSAWVDEESDDEMLWMDYAERNNIPYDEIQHDLNE